jgi:Arc/MetJ-type ribon-helix-helix transcriptional regulator
MCRFPRDLKGMSELLPKSLNARIHEDVNLGHFGNSCASSSIIVIPTIGFDRLCVISVILDVCVHDSGRSSAWHTKWPISKEAAQESALWVRRDLGHRDDGEIEAFHRRKSATNQAQKEATRNLVAARSSRLHFPRN